MTAIDVSSYAGLLAMILLTVNILLGLVLSARYNTVRQWPHRKLPIFDIHNWTAYIALCLVFLHPVVLLLSSTAGFHLMDILWPVHSPKQTLYNCFGALAFYCVTFVVVTSYLRSRLGSRFGRSCISCHTQLLCSCSFTEFLSIPTSKGSRPIRSMVKRF